MTDRIPLHIVFTMDCDSVALKHNSREVPRSWEQSARALEGYCSRLLAAGFPPTLFLAYECAAEHVPLLEELAGRGVELGLLVHPPMMELGRFKRNLGEYSPDEQRLIVDFAAERFADALGVRPRSFRAGKYSASDATFKVLYDLGFRQGSLSRPGWEIPKFAMRWGEAQANPRYTDAASRLRPGELPFFELPLSTDPSRRSLDGMPLDLTVDAGIFDDTHRVVIERRLSEMDADAAPFRALCLTTANRFDYFDGAGQPSKTLDALLAHLDELASQFEIVPTTLTGAHERFRRMRVEGLTVSG
jgi:hypothetical protein